MEQVFVVIRSQSKNWNNSQPLEAQPDWRAHAEFMVALEADGFVVLGGPLEGTTEVLLIIRAENTEQIESCLAADPWTKQEMLTISRVVPWNVRLGSI
jgi:uncharacterized protein YciI